MVTQTDVLQTIETKENFIIVRMLSQAVQCELMLEYAQHHGGKSVPERFSYSSGRNTRWLTVEEIRELTRVHIDSGVRMSG